jgi:hypothetical protein
MKKFLLFGGLGLLVVVGVLYVGVAFFLGSIAKGAVNRLGPKVTQSNVVLESATISPLSGVGTLNGFTVGNPQGWSSTPAFHLGRVHIDLDPKSVFSDVIVINELTIDQPEFNYETRLVSSNIGDLLANIEKFTGSGEKEAAKTEGPPKKFIVKKLRFTDGKATVGVGVAALPVPLPEIKLDNIGMQEGGLTGAQLSAVVLRDVLRTIVKAATEARGLTGADSLEKTKEAAKQLGDSVKDLFKKKP